jgi:hypothetical protein
MNLPRNGNDENILAQLNTILSHFTAQKAQIS